jgi:hypothetical protein
VTWRPDHRFRDLPAYIVRLNEAIGDGDIDLAYGISSALEEALSDSPMNFACGNCGLRFRFPGQLDDHYRNVHWGEPWRRAA